MFVNFLSITNLAESGPLTWDMAKQIIQSQHTLAIYGITAVVGVAAVLLVYSLIWNVFLRRHELQRATESLRREITTKIKEDFAKLSERTKDEIGKMENRLDKTVEERMIRFDKTVEERMIRFDAETARLFAISAKQEEMWDKESVWWAEAIEGYHKAESAEGLRIAVDQLNTALGKCKKLEDDDKEQIKKCLPLIPKILGDEKKQIEDKLKKLPKETTEH